MQHSYDVAPDIIHGISECDYWSSLFSPYDAIMALCEVITVSMRDMPCRTQAISDTKITSLESHLTRGCQSIYSNYKLQYRSFKVAVDRHIYDDVDRCDLYILQLLDVARLVVYAMHFKYIRSSVHSDASILISIIHRGARCRKTLQILLKLIEVIIIIFIRFLCYFRARCSKWMAGCSVFSAI